MFLHLYVMHPYFSVRDISSGLITFLFDSAKLMEISHSAPPRIDRNVLDNTPTSHVRVSALLIQIPKTYLQDIQHRMRVGSAAAFPRELKAESATTVELQ